MQKPFSDARATVKISDFVGPPFFYFTLSFGVVMGTWRPAGGQQVVGYQAKIRVGAALYYLLLEKLNFNLELLV